MHFHLMALSWSDIDTEYYCQCRVNSSCHLIHTNFIPLNPLLHHRTPTFKCMNFLSHVPNNNTTDGPISSSKVTLSGSRLIGSNFCEPPCNTHKHTLSGSRLIVSNFCEPPCNTHKHTHTHTSKPSKTRSSLCTIWMVSERFASSVHDVCPSTVYIHSSLHISVIKQD